jgi:hypothetical protein
MASNRSKGAGQLMIVNILINFAAGCASALMFASIISGAFVSLLLFYLAPLPLMVAALGWGPGGAAIGGLAASLGLGVLFGWPYLAAFLVTVALPAWWLGHLALLGRPAALTTTPADGPSALEWYPVGRIIAWTAGLATLTTMAALLTLGTDGAAITEGLRRGLLRVVGDRGTTPQVDIEQLVNALASIAPSAAAVVALLTLTVNLWLAGKITKTSGRLPRPWPDLKTASLPPMTLAVLSLALAGSFVGGLVGIVGQIGAAALLMAYALHGLATLHTLTLPLRSRTFMLGSTYALLLTFGWPILLMVALGLIDAVFNLRGRFARRAQPPATPT